MRIDISFDFPRVKPVASLFPILTGCGILCLFFNPLYVQGQIVIEPDTYKTSTLNPTGDWNDPATWEIWDGDSWEPAEGVPDEANDVFIEKDNEVQLLQNEEVRNLYIYGRDDPNDQPSRKLNLGTYNLDVYGGLKTFGGVEGDFFLESSTSGITDWIYPETGSIVFKGTSRTVVERNSWSANNQRSRYGVVFNPEPGDTLTVDAAFKASSFTIQSGTVVQTVNEEGTFATSTFSFNTQEEISTGSYGTFVVEPGATFISYGTDEFGEIIRRTQSLPAESFHLKEGASLILFGEEPIVKADIILLEGDVHYRGETGNQQFISSEIPHADYNNIFFSGAATKELPSYLHVEGNIIFQDGGEINGSDTFLDIVGDKEQRIVNLSLEVGTLQITKDENSTITFDGDLSIMSHFTMNEGSLDFTGNQLSLNTSQDGSYSYYGGTWRNLAQLNYFNLPTDLNAENSTFPFEDQFLGGIRSIDLHGSPVSDSDLTLTYTQLPGINWDPGFNDNDSAPILYKVNSYFTFNFSDPSTERVELRISADSLVVVDPLDLRIVSEDSAAPGEHLSGIEEGEFLARRLLSFIQLNSVPITLGSTGITSVLPIIWLSHAAEELLTGSLISWSTAQEVNNDYFIILKSLNDGKEFMEVGRLKGYGNTNKAQNYSFLDKGENGTEMVYYQIKQVDVKGDVDYTPVFPLQRMDNPLHGQWKIYPSPYTSGDLTLLVPQDRKSFAATIQVKSTSGTVLLKEKGTLQDLAVGITHHLKQFDAGLYFITIDIEGARAFIKWLKE
jgi:hypothetical protein